MVRPDRDRLQGRVETDEAWIGGVEEGLGSRQMNFEVDGCNRCRGTGARPSSVQKRCSVRYGSRWRHECDHGPELRDKTGRTQMLAPLFPDFGDGGSKLRLREPTLNWLWFRALVRSRVRSSDKRAIQAGTVGMEALQRAREGGLPQRARAPMSPGAGGRLRRRGSRRRSYPPTYKTVARI